MGILLLACSIALQVAAAILALRLLRDTPWKLAWGAMALGLLLMAARRGLTLGHVLLDTGRPVEMDAEVVALVISGAVLTGVWLLGPRLRSVQETAHALRASQERLTAVLEHMPDGVGLLRDGRITAANSAFERILGYPEADLLGRSPGELLHPDDRERAGREIEAVLAGKTGTPNAYRLRHRDGGYVPVEAWSRVVEFDDGTSLLTVFRDLRERRRQEAALQASDRRFTAFLEHLPAMGYIKDTEGRYVYANGVFEELMGVEGGAWEGLRAEDVLPPELVPEAREEHRAVLEGRTTLTVTRLTTAEGERVWRNQCFPIRDEEGGIAFLGGVAWDVTEEERLRERDRRLATAIEQATDMVIMTDPDGTIEYVNPAFQEVTGYDPEEAVGSNPRMLQSGEQDEAFYNRLWETLRSREPWTGRFVNRRKDGELYHQETTISPVIDARGELLGYVAIGHDVTHLLGLEERLRHAERMEALGTLTGGVAHDFNNILSVVLSSADLLLETLPEGYEEARETLEDLQRTAEVGADVVRKLLDFSRPEAMNLEPLDVRRELEDASATVRRLLPAGIELRVTADLDLPPIRADRGAVHQILINLAANARDAMEGQGHFRVHAQAAQLAPEDALQFGEVSPGAYVALSVSDNGHGMDEATANRVFEPFFTTKDRGHGTGLGLATVYSVVQQHAGMIQLNSEVGLGTTFKIFFPIAEGLPGEEDGGDGGRGGGDSAGDAAPGPLVSGEGRVVLLAEDDRALRRAATRMLERLGFRVLAAADGDEAWRAFQEAGDDVHVVVSDLVMPGLGGVELLERIHGHAPRLPLILSSGYASGGAAEAMEPVKDFVDYLQKPWTMRELTAVIGRALE